jgi:hypothetical protein
MTDVRLKLTGRLERTVDATNANIANISGDQVQVDAEWDRYKVDEGHCGPNAVSYKGPKEITRTSTTKAEFKKEMNVFVEADRTSGTVTFSLPETNGKTVHSYVQNRRAPNMIERTPTKRLTKTSQRSAETSPSRS